MQSRSYRNAFRKWANAGRLTPVTVDNEVIYVEAFSSAIGQVLGNIKAEVQRAIANEAKGNVSRN